MINTVIINASKQDREKIASLLSAQGDIKVLAQGNDSYDALRLIGGLKPDIAILDTHTELIKEEDLLPLLKIRSPSTAVVILTAGITDSQLFRAASNAVSGFVYKETDMDLLPNILKCISQGEGFISPSLAARILRLFSVLSHKGKEPKNLTAERYIHPGMDPIEHLSKMELRILTCIGEGFTSDEIAENLDLAVGTVRNYISSVMRKTGLHNRSQMARYAYCYGFVTL